jgi:erythromycin esterase-like protein
MPGLARSAQRPSDNASVSGLIARAAEPFGDIDDPAFARLFDRFADARVILLGEASHGTSEFYRARAAITRRLVEAHGFSIVAVEADWPDAATVDRHVRHRKPRPDLASAFTRFPTWMWRNTDVEAFVSWLRGRNGGLPAGQRTGFYGLDLYNLSASMRAVIDYLDGVDPEAAKVARRRYGCLEPWAEEPQRYGARTLHEGHARCEQGVVAMLREICERQPAYEREDGEAFLEASQNARLVRDAERYYRAMYRGAAESWNLRDTHMFETLEQLLAAKGPHSRAVVWAHNSHIGDARATGMGRSRGELNLGQLCRERFGEEAVLVGFGTDSGTVACASDWDEPMEVKRVLPSRPDSYERLAHESEVPRFMLDLRGGSEELRSALGTERLERFIGVIYRPETERWSHHVECELPRQFDAYVWFDATRAVTPLPGRTEPGDDTDPFGL